MTTGTLFKPWVPEWGIRIGIFLVFLPNLILLTISTANNNSASGFYGIDTNDVQFSQIIQYATFVGYFVLEKRFSNFFITKDYLFLSLSVQIIITLCSYATRNLSILLVTRFLEGFTSVNTASVCVAMIISRLQGDRAIKIGFSVIYVMLLSIFPFITLITSSFLDHVDYNELFLGAAFLFVPGIIFMLIIMKRARLRPKVPLDKIDWPSAFFFLLFLISLTYSIIYGQQLNWFDDHRIWYGFSIALVSISIFIIRQFHNQSPYIDIRIFVNKHYLIGFALLLVLYIARGALNFTTTYFSDVLGMDPLHIGHILLLNILGIICGTLVSSRTIHNNKYRLTLMVGFGCLLVYYLWMSFLFSSYGNPSTYFIPLFIQGVGTGMLLTPIVVFMVTSVPVNLNLSAITIGIFGRLTGTCVSFAIINYFTLYAPQNHFNRFQESLSSLNPNLKANLDIFHHNYAIAQVPLDEGTKLSLTQLNHLLFVQAELRSAMDYYYLIVWMLLLVIILIALAPLAAHLKRTLDSSTDHPI